MLTQQTLQQLRALRLDAMALSYESQLERAPLQDLTFDERLAMLVESESQSRDTRRVNRLTKSAKLKFQAPPEDIDYKSGRGLDKRKVASLLTCDWINRKQNIIITGPTGTGKTWLACAFGMEAIRRGLGVAYYRLPRLLEEIEISRDDGSL